jgi:DNA-binding NarL/FixJ family response regulator
LDGGASRHYLRRTDADHVLPTLGFGLGMPCRVLVVQDHPSLGSAIAGIVDAEEDMSVCGIAHTGADAMAFLTREKIDVVYMDCRMPDMTAAALADAIRAMVPGVAFVFHNAEGSESVAHDAIDSGAAECLTRSAITSREIVEAVRRAFEGAAG